MSLWLTLAAVALATVALKALGPLVLADRPLPAGVAGMVAQLGPALLAAIVVVQTFGGKELRVDERALAVASAGAALAMRVPPLAAVAVAATVAALARALR